MFVKQKKKIPIAMQQKYIVPILQPFVIPHGLLRLIYEHFHWCLGQQFLNEE
jgi:hypothetical protein